MSKSPSGQFSNAWYMVGTPAKNVTRSFSMISSFVAAPKRDSSTMVGPAANPAFSCTVWPVVPLVYRMTAVSVSLVRAEGNTGGPQ